MADDPEADYSGIPTLLPEGVLAPLPFLPQVLLFRDEQAAFLVHPSQSFIPDGLPVPLQSLRNISLHLFHVS